MYSRQIIEPPSSLVRNGHAVYGTFSGTVARLDIRGLRAPFGGVPLPVFFSNFRIKSTLSFSFKIGTYLGLISFFDNKIFGMAELDLFNTETGRKYSYKNIMGPRRRFIPHNLEQGFCASFNRRRYMRISWDHKRDRISLIFNVKGDSARPSVQAALTGRYSDLSTSEITQCSPIKSKRRCAATYCSTPRIKGSLTIGKTKKSAGQTINTEEGWGLFTVKRAYFGYQTYRQMIFATGSCDGKNIAFVLDNTPDLVPDPEVLNQNILIVDGECTPLPPVKMTQPFGIEKKWIIQDTENMVDLTFEPQSTISRELKALAINIKNSNICGKFEGVLKTKDGQDIKLNGFTGLARDQMLRI